MSDQSRAVLSAARVGAKALKVYVAAIAANHDPVEGKSVGKHRVGDLHAFLVDDSCLEI